MPASPSPTIPLPGVGGPEEGGGALPNKCGVYGVCGVYGDEIKAGVDMGVPLYGDPLPPSMTQPLPWGTILPDLRERERRWLPPHFARRPALTPLDSAATRPGAWSAPETTSTARVVMRMAYPAQTNTPPKTPTHLQSSRSVFTHGRAYEWSAPNE